MTIHTTYKPKLSIKEELANVIYNISPTATPFMSTIGRGKCSSTKFEWLEDELKTAAINAKVEGAAASAPDNVELERYHNYTQISTKNVQVTGTANVVDRAGMNTQLAYELAKVSKELKRDIEKGLTWRTGYEMGGTQVPRETASFVSFTTGTDKGSYLKVRTQTGVTNGNPVYDESGTDYARGVADPGQHSFVSSTSDATIAFTEEHLREAMLRAYTLGSEPTILMVSPGVKRTISSFPGIAEHRINVNSPKESFILGAADVYLSDFGKLSVVPNRFMEPHFAYFMDPGMAEVKYLRPFHTIDIARDGDSHKKLLVVEYGLCVKSPKGNVVVGGINP